VTDCPTLAELADDLRNSAKALTDYSGGSYIRRVADNLTNTAAILDDLADATPQVNDDGSWQATVTVREIEPYPNGQRQFMVGGIDNNDEDCLADLGITVPPPRTHTVTLDGHTLTIPHCDVVHLVAEYGGTDD
jgi:hypothetical protein